MEETQEARIIPFSSHAEFDAHLLAVIGHAHRTLQLFDPDFAVFKLGQSDVEAALRAFLVRGGTLQLAMHNAELIEKSQPRFLHLLKDYNHKISCHITNRNLRHLTDSFCVGDGQHIVRRFHSDHMRGEACFYAPLSTEISLERFSGIWEESRPGLHPTTTGL
jgi:hypothetical protein